jgi:hypothetical protein
MKRILMIMAALVISSVTASVASAQINPCVDIEGYCGGDGNCVSEWMPLLYAYCNGGSSNPAMQEMIASPGMLPPPGGNGVGQQYCSSYVPPEPATYTAVVNNQMVYIRPILRSNYDQYGCNHPYWEYPYPWTGLL